MAKAEVNIVRAVRTFVGGLNGTDIRVHFGDLFEADHPAVKKWPDAFKPIELRGRVEQATAAPGEKRGA